MEIVLLLVFFVPSIIAFARGHKSKLGIFALNLILGFTIIGWIWAFIWALSDTGRID